MASCGLADPEMGVAEDRIMWVLPFVTGLLIGCTLGLFGVPRAIEFVARKAATDLEAAKHFEQRAADHLKKAMDISATSLARYVAMDQHAENIKAIIAKAFTQGRQTL